MKNLIVIFLLSSLQIFSQNFPADLTVNVKNSLNEPVSKLELKLKEIGGKQIFYALTNNNGSVKFKVIRGKKYQIGVFKNEQISEILIPSQSTKPVIHEIVYDLSEDISDYDTTYFINPKYRIPSENEVAMKVLIYGDNIKSIANKKVIIVCPELKKVFVSKTEASGYAQFMIYPGFHYDIGVDELENLGFVDVTEKGGMTSEVRVFYQPTDIVETVKNDTITQQLKKDQQATTTHILVNVKLWDMNNKPLPNEYIYIDKNGTTSVYAAKTNEKGIVNFLLAKGKEFTVNFKYERGVYIINKPIGPKLQRINIELNTMGAENIKSFYKTAKRNNKGFRTEFLSPKTNPCTFDAQWIEKTKNGFNVNFPSQSPTSPPTINGNKLLINAGYNSSEFYSIDSKTGKSDWGAKLAENGISASVIVDDIILMNTESCTLYALDAKTGNLLWSKWLGPVIFSAPSVSNGKVFAVYPNELNSYSRAILKVDAENHFVLAAFDLKTGNIVWQSWVDNEVLSAPVACNDKIYMTSMSGTLYQFDINSGDVLFIKNDKAVSPPTIVEDNVFVALQTVKNPKTQEMAVYNAKDMSLTSRFANLSGKNLFNKDKLSPIERMNYGAGRITHMKGKNYNVINGKLFCFDNSGKISWQVTLTNNTKVDSLAKCSMPIITGNKIMINNGKKVQLYDPVQGKLIKEFPANTDLFADAVSNNGWIYTGSKTGKIISIDTKDPTINGWNTWCGNSEHNPVTK